MCLDFSHARFFDSKQRARFPYDDYVDLRNADAKDIFLIYRHEEWLSFLEVGKREGK